MKWYDEVNSLNVAYEHIGEGHREFLPDAEPDLRYKRFAEIDLSAVAGLGVSHVLVDVDGVLVPGRYLSQGMDGQTAEKLTELRHDSRFTLSLATENGNPPVTILERLHLPYTTEVFEPFERPSDEYADKTSPHFWKYACAILGIRDNPERAVMIGDSPHSDIRPAQEAGLKTIQVDRLVVHELSLGDRIAYLRAQIASETA